MKIRTIPTVPHAPSLPRSCRAPRLAQRATLHALRSALACTIALLTHPALAQTWQTVSDFQYDEVPNVAGPPSVANAMAVDAQGNIYVAGWGYEPGVSLHGLVTRSSDQGATWTMIQDYRYPTDTAIN